MSSSYNCRLGWKLALGIFFLGVGCLPLRAQDEGGAPDAELDDVPALEQGEGEDLWVLDFKFQKLRMITPRRGPGSGRTYWYMLYTLENKTGEDRDFFLSITATSDRGKVYSDLFLPSVEREIERQEGKEAKGLWGKTDKFEILAKRDPTDHKYNYTTIRANEHGDNKRQCVAVFNKLDANANKITITLAGLSNDIEERADPIKGDIEIRERIRVLEFERAGDEYEITKDTFAPLGRDWKKKSLRIEKAN